MESILKAKYLKETPSLKKKFVSARPFPHLALPGFLKKEVAIDLLEAISKEQFEKKQSDLFSLSQTLDLKAANDPVLKGFRSFLMSKEFIRYMESITGLKLKSGVIDINGSLYQDSDYLLCHDDQLQGRKIAFLFYLRDMGAKEGGSLNLFSHKNKLPDKMVKKIIPQFNTFAFFEVSPVSFHEVEEVYVKKNRIAIGGWLHGR